MTVQEIIQKIKEKFPDGVVEEKLDVLEQHAVIKTENIFDICKFLKEDAELAMDSLMCLTSIDTKTDFEVAYSLFSYAKRHRITLKVRVPRDNARVPSVEGLWKTANWHEREAYDLMGIVFTGHPNLTRILLPEDWVGHPLRKDYKFPEEYHGIPWGGQDWQVRPIPLLKQEEEAKKAQAADVAAQVASPVPAPQTATPPSAVPPTQLENK